MSFNVSSDTSIAISEASSRRGISQGCIWATRWKTLNSFYLWNKYMWTKWNFSFIKCDSVPPVVKQSIYRNNYVVRNASEKLQALSGQCRLWIEVYSTNYWKDGKVEYKMKGRTNNPFLCRLNILKMCLSGIRHATLVCQLKSYY